MSEQNVQPTPEQPEPEAAAEPTTNKHSLRGKKWVFGATLAAAGLVAGSGATYAITTATTPSQSQAFAQRGGPGSGFGAPPNGTAPNGTAPNGTAPNGAPSADSGTTTTG